MNLAAVDHQRIKADVERTIFRVGRIAAVGGLVASAMAPDAQRGDQRFVDAVIVDQKPGVGRVERDGELIIAAGAKKAGGEISKIALDPRAGRKSDRINAAEGSGANEILGQSGAKEI